LSIPFSSVKSSTSSLLLFSLISCIADLLRKIYPEQIHLYLFKFVRILISQTCINIPLNILHQIGLGIKSKPKMISFVTARNSLFGLF
jgi:hypothetical protein